MSGMTRRGVFWCAKCEETLKRQNMMIAEPA
jgi:hypothetical protein